MEKKGSKYSVVTVGADFKIPDFSKPDEFAIIELNGQHAGFKGGYSIMPRLEELRDSLHVQLDAHLAEHDELDSFVPDLTKTAEEMKCEKKGVVYWNPILLEAMLEHKAFIAQKFKPFTKQPFVHLEPEKGRAHCLKNLHAFLRELRDMDSPLFDLQRFPYLVFKPVDGAQGRGVRVFRLSQHGEVSREMRELLSNLRGNYLVEPFYMADPIYYEGRPHDWCGRLLIDRVYDSASCRPVLDLFNVVYARLSPEPLSNNSEWALKANMHADRPAIPNVFPKSQMSIEGLSQTVNMMVRYLLVSSDAFNYVPKEASA